MKIIFNKISKEGLRLINKKLPNLSSYMDKSHLKKIGKRLGITEESAKYAILNSIEETLGWRSEKQNKEWRKKRIHLWFSTLTICIDEIDPFKRWEKVKLSIIDTLAQWDDNPVWAAFEIIRDPKQPFDIIPKGFFDIIDRPRFLPPITEYCLQTVILFNARDFDTPSDIFYWGADNPNFCEWRFRKNGILFKIKLKNGDIREKYISGIGMDTIKKEQMEGLLSNYAKKYFPEYENQYVSFKSTFLPDWVPNNWLMDSHKLRIDLGDSYLAGLSKDERIKIFEQLVKTLGFDPFMYKTFHNILKEWMREEQYERIESVLHALKNRYSRKSNKKQKTEHDYALLCLQVIEKILQNKIKFAHASRLVYEDMENSPLGVKRGSNDPEQIRVRSLEVIKKESKSRKFDLKSEGDLKDLQDQIKKRYSIKE